MNIAMIGTGYVGLVTGTCLAEFGNRVICVDKDEDKIRSLNEGCLPIYETGLDELYQRNRKDNRLQFSTDLASAVQDSQLIFICVGTPSNVDGSTDLGAVFGVAKQVGRAMNEYKIVITKSTVPVGTTERIRSLIADETEIDFDVASNPEFLKEGEALNDFLKPDKIVIGADAQDVTHTLKELYSPFVQSQNPIIVMDIQSSEMTKYACNAMLAAKISFMNEIANMCDLLGADVEMVRKGVSADSRIGPHFLFPGLGYGGSCLPKDVKSLVHMGREHDFSLRICEAIDSVNEGQTNMMINKIHQHFDGDLKNKNIAVWGLAFKPHTDDIREAPSIKTITSLLQKGSNVAAHDPKAIGTARAVLGDDVKYHEDCYSALKGANALVIATEWSEFRNPDFAKIKKLMAQPVIFDGRNIYDPSKLRELGFTYYGMGRPAVAS
ncbi:MAG: UDP-glucose/GDP-mannose dehydrogenase family protein [Chloroflexi bacterium]|nr:UDP-glucose/GDP-mannose dehydrogenase family protein [Chloroflexota bacterium]